jgi:hypothetical protein
MSLRSGLFRCLALLALSACDVAPPHDGAPKEAPSEFSASPMRMFGNPTPSTAVRRANADIAREFLDLTFALENGRRLKMMTRFEEPITVKFAGEVPPYAERDLDQLIARLQKEARIDIRRVPAEEAASIVIELVPPGQMAFVAPTAACFVVPNAESWDDFRRNRRSLHTDWSEITERHRVAIFIPEDAPPQEIRDCLHEEIAQALGPLNDLFRLRDSIFNDDNFNLVLQPFDMLMLRIYYAPELRNGMTRAQVSERLPALLAQLNPAGRNHASDARPRTGRDWTRQIEIALGRNGSSWRRIQAATRAIEIADARGYNDQRIGFSFLARARVSSQTDPERAALDYATAYSIFYTLFGADDIHTAQTAVQMAWLALSAGEVDDALVFIDGSIPAARRAQDATMLFNLLALKSHIEVWRGNPKRAAQLRAEAISWGKYGLLSERELSRRLNQIDSLQPPEMKAES